MALKLRVISDHYQHLGKMSSRLFGVSGGTIGRARSNDWVLPDQDRYISSHHAKVRYDAGNWLLEDTSTNGVFVNDGELPLSQEGPYALKDGDRLRMGDYDILVSIDERTDFPPDASGQLSLPTAIKTALNAAKQDSQEDLNEELDIADLFTPGVEIQSAVDHGSSGLFATGRDLEAKATESRTAKPTGVPVLPIPSEDLHQRTVVHGKESPDWHMATRPLQRRKPGDLTPARSRTPERPRSPELGSDANSGLEAFCRGAGLDPAAFSSDTQISMLTLAGQMVREMVLGLMEALKNRADLKGKFNLSQTTIQPNDNNPLKFSASVDEALLKLLDAHSSRYLGPVEALRDAFGDIKTHQLAVNAATQAGLDEIMNRLDPTDLQERFDRGLKRGALLGAANKMKYWDLYTEFYQVLNQRDEKGLPPVFTEEFTRAYTERVAGFHGQRKKS